MKKQILLAALILMLQGCIIGSGNDKDPSPTNSDLNQKIIGGYLHINGTKIDEDILNGTNFNHLKINHKNISIQFPNTTSGISDFYLKSNSSKSYTRYIVSDKKYHQTRFGLIKMGNETYLFNQGYASEDIPKSGKYIYNGEAAVSLNHQYGNYSGVASATSTVDFAKKSMTVKIITPEVQPREIHFGATIHGNSFSGDQGFISDGRFYGKNAEELSGYFIKQTDNFGVFGGEKAIKIQ